MVPVRGSGLDVLLPTPSTTGWRRLEVSGSPHRGQTGWLVLGAVCCSAHRAALQAPSLPCPSLNRHAGLVSRHILCSASYHRRWLAKARYRPIFVRRHGRGEMGRIFRASCGWGPAVFLGSPMPGALSQQLLNPDWGPGEQDKRTQALAGTWSLWAALCCPRTLFLGRNAREAAPILGFGGGSSMSSIILRGSDLFLSR